MNSKTSSPDSEPTSQIQSALSRLTAEKTRRLTENRLAYYRPYPKQLAFFRAGLDCRERCLQAANRSGKSLASAIEVACHATGRYPPWWPGRRFDRETHGWVVGISNETLRDSMMRLLLGQTTPYGSGTIPKEYLIDTSTARGIADLVDTIRVAHVSGGVSTITLKSAAAGREKFQGAECSYVALDEEAPFDVYMECLTRVGTTRGLVWLTFTPLLGVSEVVRRFMYEQSQDRALIGMTIDDCEHFDDEQRRQIIESYGPHEVLARTRGVPTMGSGRIFPVAETQIQVERREIPPDWPRIGAMDMGFLNWAAVELAIDRTHDVTYLIRAIKVKEQTPVIHASILRRWGKELRWAWPADGKNKTSAGGGIPLKEQYEAEGLNMLWENAKFEDGSASVEAGLNFWLDMMKTERFKAFSDLEEFFREFNLYHRDEHGRVVKENDHILDACRYALMSLRFAQTRKSFGDFRRELIYPADKAKGDRNVWR